jgi:hypothetical protein
MKSAEEAIKEAKEKLEKSKEPVPLSKEEASKMLYSKKDPSVVVNITQIIKKATTETAHSYKKNIDSVLGVLSYALFATCIYEGVNIFNKVPDASIFKAIFDLFCAVTLIVAKHRVKKGDLSKFFDMTSDQTNKDLHNFFVDDDNDSKDIIKF